MVEITNTARAVRFAPCHRIVASRLPTIHLFERVADPADWDALYELESRTNPRIRTELGELSLVPVPDRVSGPNASIVMASVVIASGVALVLGARQAGHDGVHKDRLDSEAPRAKNWSRAPVIRKIPSGA
jgi:hypothetical protein